MDPGANAMMVTDRHVDIAKRRAAEVRRYIEETRLRIAQLRRSGADASGLELQLQTILPVVERFESHVEAMQFAARPGGGAGE